MGNIEEPAPTAPEVEPEVQDTVVPEAGPPSDVGASSDSDKKDDQVKDTDSQKEPVLDTQKEPVLERKSSKVSFDEPIETKRKDSYTGVPRVSFEKPADLY